MDFRQERVHAETERHILEGTIMLPTEGYRSRISDFLNARDREFLVFTDAEIRPIDAHEPAQKRDFVVVSVRHLVMLW